MDRQWRPPPPPPNVCPTCFHSHFPFCPPPPPFPYANPNFKRPRIDDNLINFSDDQRRLKLIRDHGSHTYAPHPNHNGFSPPHNAQFRSSPHPSHCLSDGYHHSHTPHIGAMQMQPQPPHDGNQHNLNGRVVHYPYPYSAPNDNNMEVSRFFMGQPQPPLPSSPPPPLPMEPSMNQLKTYFSPPKKPPSLFPVPEPHPMPQPYYPASFPSEEPSKQQYLGDSQSFALNQLAAERPKVIDTSRLFQHPHRASRPDHFVIIFRGLSGIFLAIPNMTLLEVIKEASVNSKPLDSPLDYPIVLNPGGILPNLKPEVEDESSSSLIKPLIGWQISQTDAEIIDISKKFFTQLEAKLKNANNLNKGEFISSLNSYLENIRDKLGVVIGVDSSCSSYTRILIEKLGVFMGKDVAGLVLDGSVSLEIWEVVQALIVNGITEHSCYSNLVTKLVLKKRSDLLCLCIKHGFDLGSSEILTILRYFLSPSKDAYDSMITVKKEWEGQALLAIEKASDSNLKKKYLLIAKEASILLMMAYDGFSASEICLHYLFSSSNINDVMLSPSFSKLNSKELINLIRYLAKWLKKYERFPQAGPCPKASSVSVLGLKVCDWVPKFEDVIKCLGLILDENFSSLVLHPQFHKELRSIEGVVSCLTIEAKFCHLMTDVVDKIKIEVKGENN